MLHALIMGIGMMVGFADDEALRTVAERSGFRATARHDDVMALCRALAESSKSARLEELGKSTEGRSIPLLMVADPPVKTPEEAARSGKLVALLIGDIHAGEVCGKEALPMLAREILANPGHPLLKDLILAIVPIYNPDGNERVSKSNRPGQVGPEEGMGQRANAQAFDLNRDFIKLEAPETRALMRFVNRWDPHLIIDTHTTNGSHHRYVLTYQGPQNPAGDRKLRAFVRETMLPEVDRAFEDATGERAFFYGNFERDHTQWTTFPAQPRFGTNALGLRNRIAILSEAYAYAPYKARVLATRDFVRECLKFAASHKDDIRGVLDEARSASISAGRDPKPDDRVAIRSEPKAFAGKVTALGFVEEERNGRRVATEEPKDYQVDLVQDFAPTVSVTRPFAYLLPAKHGAVIEALQRHGLEVAELREDMALDVEVYRIDAIKRAERRFEGHHTVDLDVTARDDSRTIRAGTIVVKIAQPLGSLAVYLLEPRSDDGLATWNAFDSDLVVGSDFPVIRLPHPVPLLTSPARPLPEDRRYDQPITLSSTRRGGGGRFDLAGPAAQPRWLDEEHFLQAKEGRLHRVEATTGRATPFLDAKALTRALAGLPGLDEEAASRLAQRTNFDMDPSKKGALFDHEGDLYYAAFDGRTAARLTKTKGEEEIPSFSPDGSLVAFVRDNDLRVVDIATQKETALTTGGTEMVRNGKADWVYYEEIFNRNWKAYWWSPDSQRLAFFQVDDGPVKDHVILNDTGESRQVERAPYPRSGDPNPKLRLGIASIANGPVRWADLSSYPEGSWLISHVAWCPDGRAVLAYLQDRSQTWLDIVRVPVDGATPKRLFRETTRAWVDNPGSPHWLDDGSFLLPSERDGWKHLYHFDAEGSLRRQVTSGEWEVLSVEYLDKKGGFVYFTATKDNPVAANFYRVSLGGGPVERLTWEGANHSVAMSPDGKRFVDAWSDPSTPTRVKLLTADGRLVRTIDSHPAYAIEEYRLAPKERVHIKTKDGFVLEGALVTPLGLDPNKLYPVWFSTYGGPHTPTVSDAWAGGGMFDQALASEGFVVFHVDPRSASGKGAVSTWSAYKQLGVKELEDIKEAIAWLKQKPYVDGSRIGMSGHSYGGFMTAFAMTHSDLFAAGIAGAPVTDWHDYDSVYTERYMLTPQENPKGYEATSVVSAAKDLHGKLMIIHGGIDDNVSIRNTMRLVHALQQADKDFELMIYPGSRHGVFGRHYSRLQIDFMKRALGGPKERKTEQ